MLRRFIDRFDLVKLQPEPTRVVGGVPPGGSVQVLAEGDQAYAVYLRRVAPAGTFSARWTGVLVPPAAGTYQLHVTSNDGVRITAGGRVVFEDWTDHATKTDTVSIDLIGPGPDRRGVLLCGRRRRDAARLDRGRTACARRYRPRPGGWAATIRADGASGVQAAYFRGIGLADRWFERAEPNVDQEFGHGRADGRHGTLGGPATVEAANRSARGRLERRLDRSRHGRPGARPRRSSIPAVCAPSTLPAWHDDVALALRRVGPFQGGR